MAALGAVAERSVLADSRKDSGVVSLFPLLAGEWDRQWPQDLARLQKTFFASEPAYTLDFGKLYDDVRATASAYSRLPL